MYDISSIELYLDIEAAADHMLTGGFAEIHKIVTVCVEEAYIRTVLDGLYFLHSVSSAACEEDVASCIDTK